MIHGFIYSESAWRSGEMIRGFFSIFSGFFNNVILRSQNIHPNIIFMGSYEQLINFFKGKYMEVAKFYFFLFFIWMIMCDIGLMISIVFFRYKQII